MGCDRLSDSVRLELGQAGIDHVKITTDCPHYIRTGMFEGAQAAPLLPLLEPENVCDLVAGRLIGVHRTMEDFTGRQD